MTITREQVESEFALRSPLGITHKTKGVSNHDKIETIMEEGLEKGKIWWFAYEFAGRTFTKKYGDVFVSYEVSSRIAEMLSDGRVVAQKSEGKLFLYRLPDSKLGI